MQLKRNKNLAENSSIKIRDILSKKVRYKLSSKIGKAIMATDIMDSIMDKLKNPIGRDFLNPIKFNLILRQIKMDINDKNT